MYRGSPQNSLLVLRYRIEECLAQRIFARVAEPCTGFGQVEDIDCPLAFRVDQGDLNAALLFRKGERENVEQTSGILRDNLYQGAVT
jgi:hypothetical protein